MFGNEYNIGRIGLEVGLKKGAEYRKPARPRMLYLATTRGYRIATRIHITSTGVDVTTARI